MANSGVAGYTATEMMVVASARQLAGQVDHAESTGAPRQQPQDRRGAFDGLDGPRHARSRTSTPDEPGFGLVNLV
jgi:hypothetical protein